MKQILISRTLGEVRIAVIEDGQLAEFQIERNCSSRISGNIYKGRVLNAAPAIRASFVDIGTGKAGIVSWKDIASEEKQDFARGGAFSEGRDIIVQAVKEPVAEKGPRMKSRVSLAGKYVILSTDSDRIGVSRKISGGAARSKVGTILEKLRPKKMGLIARTAAVEKEFRAIEKEVKKLKDLWTQIVQMSRIKPSPSLLWREPEAYLRAVRDFASPGDEIIADDWPLLLEINRHIDENFPGENICVGYHSPENPLFAAFGIDEEISGLFQRKVNLKSGGDMVIEEAEGLTVIDVNTGAGTNRGGTLLRTNLEAAQEAARQIRLRNLVGIIVIDFIDMGQAEMKKIRDAFSSGMAKDRTSHTISELSEFCVLHLTRKRSRESVAKTLCQPCGTCGGAGLIKSKETVCYEIARETLRAARARTDKIRVCAHKDIVRSIGGLEPALFENLAKQGTEIICEETEGALDNFTVKGEWKT